MSREQPTGRSFVVNCFIKPKDGERFQSLFMPTPDGVLVALDGYAIVPREEYERLVASSEQAVTEQPT